MIKLRASNTVKGSLSVAGAFLIHFSLGTIYTFGNMSPYIASFLKFRTHDTGVTTGDTVWILAATFFPMGTLMAVGGIIGKRIGARPTCMIGCWTMSFCVAMTYFTIKKSLFAVIVTYGLGFGTGIGLSYSVALAAAMKWFPLQRGLISGIVVGGFGLGSFLFNLVQTGYINPKNIPPKRLNGTFNYSGPFESIFNTTILSADSNITASTSTVKYFVDESILNNVPMCFVIIGVAYAIIQLFGIILLMDYDSSHPTEGVELKHVNGNLKDEKTIFIDETEATDEKTMVEKGDKEFKFRNEVQQKEYSVAEAVKNRMFWLLLLTFFFNGIVIVTISAVFKSFGQQFIDDDQYFAILGSVGGICNCLGRVVWGRLLDRFKYRIDMSTLTILMALTMGTFYFCSFIPNLIAAKVIYFIYGCLLFIALSGSFAILPGAAAQCFGSSNLATIYGLIVAGLAFASIVGAIVSSLLFQWMQFRGQFIMATISSLISLTMTQFYKPPPLVAEDDKSRFLDNESAIKV